MDDVDDYLATLEDGQRAAFEPIRQAVRRLAPDAEQGRSYGMPAYRFDGRPLLAVQAARNHLAVYPFSPSVVDAVSDELEGFDVSKGTIRFDEAHPLPGSVIERVISLRLEELRS